MPSPAPSSLSKSKIMAGIQCLKRLYFQIYNPGLAESGDEGSQARFIEGREVGLLAQQIFPGGRTIGFEGVVGNALAKTMAMVEDASVPAIFEATFRHASVLVRVDILERLPQNHWRLIEVKSSLDLKPHYLDDLAIQQHVVRACGLDVASAHLVHLSRDYRYDGVEYDLRALFTGEDVTREIAEIDSTLPALFDRLREALACDAPPEIAPGDQCKAPYTCEFFGHCNPDPPENHISFLPRLSEKKRHALVEQGFALIHEIPEDFPLSETQTHVWTAVKAGRPWVSETLREELTELGWSLYFMDFESLYPAIPRFAGMRPYSQIPFQWSVHRRVEGDAQVEHFEFLAEDERDPRPEFIESLCEAVGTRGPIVVYNAGFESQRLGELAGWLPEYAARIDAIRPRLWDLLPFVRKHVYHPKFNGSFSIKSVLPALVPEMTYEGMEIAHGEAAGLAWDRMVRGGVDPDAKQRLKVALLEYCGQDTFAMVRLLETLRAFGSIGEAGGSAGH